MEVRAKISYLRISPRKSRLVVDLIRGKSVKEAEAILKFTIKKAKQPVVKLLQQAVANAINNKQLDKSNLYISRIIVDEGPKYKRLMPRSRGRADQIQKKTSHITITLDEIDKSKQVSFSSKNKKKEIVSQNNIKEDVVESIKTNKKDKDKKSIVVPKHNFGVRPKTQSAKAAKIFRRKSV